MDTISVWPRCSWSRTMQSSHDPLLRKPQKKTFQEGKQKVCVRVRMHTHMYIHVQACAG